MTVVQVEQLMFDICYLTLPYAAATLAPEFSTNSYSGLAQFDP